jgi:hypothetical protein
MGEEKALKGIGDGKGHILFQPCGGLTFRFPVRRLRKIIRGFTRNQPGRTLWRKVRRARR